MPWTTRLVPKVMHVWDNRLVALYRRWSYAYPHNNRIYDLLERKLDVNLIISSSKLWQLVPYAARKTNPVRASMRCKWWSARSSSPRDMYTCTFLRLQLSPEVGHRLKSEMAIIYDSEKPRDLGSPWKLERNMTDLRPPDHLRQYYILPNMSQASGFRGRRWESTKILKNGYFTLIRRLISFKRREKCKKIKKNGKSSRLSVSEDQEALRKTSFQTTFTRFGIFDIVKSWTSNVDLPPGKSVVSSAGFPAGGWGRKHNPTELQVSDCSQLASPLANTGYNTNNLKYP